jgi:hypothetical protein
MFGQDIGKDLDIKVQDVCPQRKCSLDRQWACRHQAERQTIELFIKWDDKEDDQDHYNIINGICGQSFYFDKRDYIKEKLESQRILDNKTNNSTWAF